MTKKIDLGLFVRLMETPSAARNDLLEYIGTGPIAVDHFLSDRPRCADLAVLTPARPVLVSASVLKGPRPGGVAST